MAGSDYGPGWSGSPQPEPPAWQRWLRRLRAENPERDYPPQEYPPQEYPPQEYPATAGPDPEGRLRPDDVERARFASTKFREGYDQEEVDTFLDRVVTRLRGAAADQPATPLTAQDVVRQRFSPTKLRAGYDQQEVDDFLDRIVTELRRQETDPNSE